jgi:hypothetical protein
VTLIGLFLVTVHAAQQTALDRQTVTDAVAAIAKVVSDEYFDPAIGERAAAHLRQYAAQTMEPLATPDRLAAALTRELYAATHDKHLAVAVVGSGASSAPSTSGPTAAELRAARAARENFGFRQVSILEGNVGYVDVRTFYRVDEARATVDAAMRFLSHADALIIDLRSNQGGSPETVALLAGYLFDEPGRALFDIVPRSGAAVHYATPASAVEGRHGSRPTYALTSSRTFSAGEGFAFILQEEQRAVVVGEQTAGAANPGRSYPAGAGFEVTVPNGQVRTAKSGRNWEGSGVTPDVVVSADRAQATALELATRRLAAR